MTDENQPDISSVEELIKSGDISLSERREKIALMIGRQTTLADDKLTLALAMQSDDDDEELVRHVLQLEAETTSAA